MRKKVLTIAALAGCGVAFGGSNGFDKVLAGDPDPKALVIEYNKFITPTCDAVERYNTVFHPPTGEKIIDVAVGDGMVWKFSKSDTGDAAYIKPAIAGIGLNLKTNIDISTDHGNHYTCIVIDRSGQKDYHPQLNVFFQPTDKEMLDAIQQKRKFVTVEEFDAVQHAADQYKIEADEATRQAEHKITEVKATAKQDAMGSLVRDYQFPDKAKGFPWFVREVARDGQHSYIFVDPSKLDTGAEVGSVYEKLDGKLATLDAPYNPKLHAYVTSHPILGEGVIKVGKKQVDFRRNS